MAVEHLALGQALHARGEHILLADLVEEGVLGQQRRGGERAERHGGDRQRDMPEVVGDLPVPGHEVPVLRGQPAQGEDLPERAAGEEHDQQDREEEARDGIADDDDGRGPDVEGGAVPHRLPDAERDRDRVGEQRHPEAEGDRDRQLLLDELQHRDVAEIALAEIEAGIVPDHLEEALVGRLVEAELRFELLDELRVEALRAAIAGRGVAGTRACAAGALRAEIASAAGDARGGAGILPLQLRDDALHRAAGRELHDHEGDEHDPEDRRDHEKHAACDIGEHQAPALAGRCGRDGCRGSRTRISSRSPACGRTRYAPPRSRRDRDREARLPPVPIRPAAQARGWSGERCRR